MKFKFYNPMSISIGNKLDVISISFVEPGLFISKETGKSLNSDTTTSNGTTAILAMRKVIPR